MIHIKLSSFFQLSHPCCPTVQPQQGRPARVRALLALAALFVLRHLSWLRVGNLEGKLAARVITSPEAPACQWNQCGETDHSFHYSTSSNGSNEAKCFCKYWMKVRKTVSLPRFRSCLRCRVELWQKFKQMEYINVFFFVSSFCHSKSWKFKCDVKVGLTDVFWQWPLLTVCKGTLGQFFTVQIGSIPCQYASSHSWCAKMSLIHEYLAIFFHYHLFLFISPNNKN